MNCVFYDTLREEKIAKEKNTEEKNAELKNANIGQIRIISNYKSPKNVFSKSNIF